MLFVVCLFFNDRRNYKNLLKTKSSIGIFELISICFQHDDPPAREGKKNTMSNLCLFFFYLFYFFIFQPVGHLHLQKTLWAAKAKTEQRKMCLFTQKARSSLFVSQSIYLAFAFSLHSSGLDFSSFFHTLFTQLRSCT